MQATTSPEPDRTAIPGTTEQIAAFIVNTHRKDVPEAVWTRAQSAVLDGIGLALAGSVSATSRIFASYLTETGPGTPTATVLGSSQRLAARFAALLNGIAIHAEDYDDTQLAGRPDRVYGLLTHPTAPVLPAALAAAETTHATGTEFLMAYIIGVEVACKVAEAILPRHYRDGFHSTATCGPLGAAAAASRLYGLDLEHTRTALGIAASQAGGLRENFGTMTKPLHAGRAAESGLLAADLAARGWTASPTTLEAPRGFFQAAGGGYDEQAIHGTLGNPWTFVWPGISMKPHPSGSLTHPGMTAMAELIGEHRLTADRVRRIRVGVNQNVPNALIHHLPTTGLQAKFSLEFCLAILLIVGRAGLAEFTDRTVCRPDVQHVLGKVELVVHPDAEAAGYDKMATLVEVELTDGTWLQRRCDFALGSPQVPLSEARLQDKFTDCAQHAGWPRPSALAAIEAISKLQQVPDVNELTQTLRRLGSEAQSD